MEAIIRNFLNEKIEKNHYTAGSVLFGKPFQPILNVQLGKISRIHSVDINERTVFDLQSMTKALCTSLLFIYKQAQGQIDLTATIDDFLPEFSPTTYLKKSITIKQLLNHSSGLSDADLEEEFASPYDMWNRIFSAPLHFPSGTSIEYCDLGYRILGKIFETKFGESLEAAVQRLIYTPLSIEGISYEPMNCFNVTGTPRAHGVIDDQQVRFLGGNLGCDGLFGNAGGIFNLLSNLVRGNNLLQKPLGNILKSELFDANLSTTNFFESLAVGPKTLGWEFHSPSLSYAGKFHSDSCFEKAGGAGTFVWFDQESECILVYLTNYGKPQPFDEQTWNKLIADLEPHTLSNLIYEAL